MGRRVRCGVFGVLAAAALSACTTPADNAPVFGAILPKFDPGERGVPTVAPSPVPSPPATRLPATATAAAPFDGEYRGGLQLGALADGSGYGRLSEALRRIEVQVINGQGTGTVVQTRCPAVGAVSLRISPTGSVDGEMDLLVTGTCAPLKTRMEGRAEGDLLVLTVTDGRRSTDLSLRRPGSPE